MPNKDLDEFINKLKKIKPQEKAEIVSETIEKLASMLPPDARLPDLAIGWNILAKSSSDDKPIISAKRQLCAELAKLAQEINSAPGDIENTISAWNAWNAQLSFEMEEVYSFKTASLKVQIERELEELRIEQEILFSRVLLEEHQENQIAQAYYEDDDQDDEE